MPYPRLARLFALLLLCANLACADTTADTGTARAEAPTRPNILLIVADDLGFGDLGIAGSVTNTPTLEHLASQGLTFTRFHASPVCSVTRAMLLTGNDPIQVGLGAFDYAVYPPAEGRPGYEAYLTRNTATIAELLRDAGYRTYMVGKWHLGGTRHGGEGPHEWGFDQSYGIYTGGANHWNQDVFHVDIDDPVVRAEVQAGRVPQEPYFENGRATVRPLGIYSDALFTAKMLEYLERGRHTGKPFFAYVAYTTPHAPLQAPDFLIEPYIEHYYALGYEGLKRARFASQKRHGIIPPEAPFPDASDNPLLRPWADLSEDAKRRYAKMMATYSAMMESQDFHIGLLLNYLRETGQLDDTLILYLGDNGPEGLDVEGALSNPRATRWVEQHFSQAYEDIGAGNAFGFLGTGWANAATGGLQWWKWFIGEGGVRTPLILRPPADQPFPHAGGKSDTLVSVKDLPMTILDYAGVKHPGREYRGRRLAKPTGVSMRDYLAGDADQPRTADQWLAFELFGNGYIAAGDDKAIRVRPGMWGDGEWHLYDIRRDPGETTPLDDKEPERLKALVAQYEQYAEANGLVPVADNWNPWHGFLGADGKPLKDQKAAAEAAKKALESAP
jgi:arylsulfatase A-like enzyme